jgi:hypothetical protein
MKPKRICLPFKVDYPHRQEGYTGHKQKPANQQIDDVDVHHHKHIKAREPCELGLVRSTIKIH